MNDHHEKDGIETVKAILAIDPAAVIYTMSGRDADGEYQETARILEARRGFEKPVEREELLAAIPDHLDGSDSG